MTTIHTTLDTRAFGRIQLIAGDGGLRGLHLEGQKHFIQPDPTSRHDPQAALFAQTIEQLDAYAAGELRDFDLPIEFVGTPGRVALWTALQDIPFGETTTYGALAAALGKPGGAQSVGQGVGNNPVAIVVPCHRVLGADGSLTGYAGGIERKRQLLELEGVLQPELL